MPKNDVLQLRLKRLWYPTVQDIIDTNDDLIKLWKATKADKHEILGNLWKLQETIDEAKRYKGIIERKAAILMRGINHAHAFGSANKRTGFAIANKFIGKNKNYLLLKRRNKQREIAIKIRQRIINDDEIAKWLGEK